MSKILIIKKEDLSILHKYDSSVPDIKKFGGEWGNEDICLHLLLPENLDPDCVQVVGDSDNPQIVEDESLVAQKQQRTNIELAKRAKLLGEETLAIVWAINESKELSEESLLSMMNDENLLMVERLLKNGALKTAKSMIENMHSEHFTEQEKQAILDFLNSSGLV